MQERSCSLQCECHVKMEDDTARRAMVKLALVSVVALILMIGQVVGK